MVWFYFALITAFSEATKDLFSKKAMRSVDEYVSAWSLSAFSALFLAPLIILIEIPTIGRVFWSVVLFQGVMLTITQLLYMRAIKSSPLSLTLPMLAFTPAFMLITSPLILGESPNRSGVIGILLIVLGAYVLNVQKLEEGLTAPFRALFIEKGPLLMIIVALLWSVTANVDKIGVINSTPLFYSLIVMIANALGLSISMHLRSVNYREQVKNNIKSLLPIGFFAALAIASQMTAIELTLASFVISIKRTSILVGSIYGFIFFKERDVKHRLAGASIMVLGILLITLWA